MKYDDGKVPAFHHAEIGSVDADFQWPQAGPKAHPVPVNEECLLRIYNCENLGSLSVEDILKPFSTFAIAKMARFDDSNEVVLEFAQKDDLEGVGMKFADGKVAALGHNATIDDENGFDARKFYERYQQMQSSVLSSPFRKLRWKRKKRSTMTKATDSRKKRWKIASRKKLRQRS